MCQAGSEKMLEIVDYAARKLTRLQSGYDFKVHNPLSNMSSENSSFDKPGPDASEERRLPTPVSRQPSTPKRLKNRDPKDDLAQQLTEIEFKICISACTIARYLSEHADAMPLNVVSRITDTHDFLILILPLIENPPGHVGQRLESGKSYKTLSGQKLPPLTCSKSPNWKVSRGSRCTTWWLRKSFERGITSITSVKDSFCVRKYLNEVILDQLPFLADIMRYMDELAISEVANDDRQNAFMLQQVSETRESIVKDQDWKKVADIQMQEVFYDR